MAREKLTWRSFADVRARDKDDWGRIAAAWNLRGTPTLFLLDHQGVIRYKWLGSPGPKKIDAAVAALIKEAEGAGKEGSK
jgi:hypothetical protein